MFSRKIGFFLAILMVAVFQANVVSGTDLPDEQYTPHGPLTPNDVWVQFDDNMFTKFGGFLSADATSEVPDGHASKVAQALCSSYDDPACQAGVLIHYFAHLPVCQSISDTDCIESVFAVKPDGTSVPGTFVRGIPDQVTNNFLGNRNLGIPSPGTDGLWKIAGVNGGGGGDLYMASAVVSGEIHKSAGSTLNSTVPLLTFNAGLFPVTIVSGSFKPSFIDTEVMPNGVRRLGYHAGDGPYGCLAVSTTECALRQSFSLDTKFGMSLRLSQEMKGWLHGRVRDPQVEYRSDSFGTHLKIFAYPVTVPLVDASTNIANFPNTIPGVYDDIVPGSGFIGFAWGDFMMKLLKVWLPIIKDTAQANPSQWVIRNLQVEEMAGADICIANSASLAGFVSTNSTVYSAGPPTFNPVTESLDYTLVSPHFTSKGEVFKGVYTLAIRSDVARCLYHFTNAPVKATISVTDDSGASSVAVESMNEHDGWIYLSASNFEFSSPTVHIKLSQDAPVAKPSVMPSPTAIAKPQIKKVTVTCSKGKVVKKVTGPSPKCPSGYKKK